MVIDKLIEGIKKTKCPVCVGLDTLHTYLPEPLKSGASLEEAAEAIFEFNKEIVDSICDIAPSVKIQAACYERYGIPGMETFKKTIEYSREKGLIVIADVKRGDIGSTAAAYSAAYLSGDDFGSGAQAPFDADFITVNAYLGTDGVKPFADDCKKTGKGMFILVRTSNPSGSELQNAVIADSGKTVYEKMAERVEKWGEETIGKYGYSSVGAVVGATCPEEAEKTAQSS